MAQQEEAIQADLEHKAGVILAQQGQIAALNAALQVSVLLLHSWEQRCNSWHCASCTLLELGMMAHGGWHATSLCWVDNFGVFR